MLVFLVGFMFISNQETIMEESNSPSEQLSELKDIQLRTEVEKDRFPQLSQGQEVEYFGYKYSKHGDWIVSSPMEYSPEVNTELFNQGRGLLNLQVEFYNTITNQSILAKGKTEVNLFEGFQFNFTEEDNLVKANKVLNINWEYSTDYSETYRFVEEENSGDQSDFLISNITKNRIPIREYRNFNKVTNLNIFKRNILPTGWSLDPSVSSCATLSSAGVYTLTQDISSTGTCLTISSSDVHVDGAGYNITYGTTGLGNGIYIDGPTGNYHNISIYDIKVYKGTTGGTNSNYGILLRELENSTFRNITIETHGVASNYGVYALGVYDNILFDNLTIQTNGTTSSNRGIVLSNNVGRVEVWNSTIRANGGAGTNIALEIQSDNSLAQNNYISSSGTSSYGVYILNNENATLKQNTINSEGGSATTVLLLSGTNHTMDGNYIEPLNGTTGSGLEVRSNYNVIKNNIIMNSYDTGASRVSLINGGDFITMINNTLKSQGPGANKYILQVQNSDYGNYTENNITSDDQAGTSNYGIWDNTGVGNDFIENSIVTGSDSTSDAFVLNSNNATLINNNIIFTGGYDLEFGAGRGWFRLVDQYAEDYIFITTGAEALVEDTQFGKIDFFTALTGSGNNWSDDVQIGNNSIYFHNNTGLNVSSNLTLYGMADRFNSSQQILKDGFVCTDCYNFTSLNADTIIFNVTSFGNYTINGSSGAAPPGPSDTCTYTSGDWNVACSDNCTITSNVDLGGNDIYITGKGSFILKANITNYVKRYVTGDTSGNICSVTRLQGGGFKP